MSPSVQSSIAVIGFPGTWDELDAFLYTNETLGEGAIGQTDIDILLNVGADEGVEWTAPRWMTEGDILFFYHAKSASQKVARLRKEFHRELPARPDVEYPEYQADIELIGEARRLLDHAAEQADRYAGRIFACARVGGPSGYQATESWLHFAGRSFAPTGPVHIFERPLDLADMAEFVKVGQATPNTPLYDRQFDGIKALIAKRNVLPGFLQDARIGGRTFRDVDQKNWPEISCSPEARFVNEEQVRSYLLDFLLEELKDDRTPLLRECRCLRGGKQTGFADYFVRISGDWVPVEAKLNALSVPKPKLLQQVARYVGIDSFSPTLGKHVGKEYRAATTPSRPCILADQAGVYLVANGQFRGCSPGRPLWRREDLNHSVARQIRRKVGVASD